MPVKRVNDDGEEEELYTADEFTAINTEKAAAEARALDLDGKLKEKTNDIVKMKDGFKRFEEMSTEEKAAMSEREKQLLIQQEEILDGRKKDIEAAKNAMFEAAARRDPKVLEKLKEKYALVGMPETSTEEIRARINAVLPWANAELGISETHPIEAAMLGGAGEAPRMGKDDDKNRFAESDKGKAVEKEMFGGILPAK